MKQLVRGSGLAVFLVLASVFMFFVQAAAWAGVVEDAQVQYDSGVALEKQGKRAEAISEWQTLLAHYPQGSPAEPQLDIVRAGALLRIGEAQRQSDQLATAQATFVNVLSEYPQCRSYCVDAIIGIAKIHQKRGEYLDAVKDYGRVLRDYPEKILQGSFARTRIYEVQKTCPDLPDELKAEAAKACAAYEEAKKKDEDITAARKRALADAEAGKVEEAKAALLPQLSDPAVLRSHGCLRMLGIAMGTIGDKDNARVAFEKAFALAANDYDPPGYLRLRVEGYFYVEDNNRVLTESASPLQLCSNPSIVGVLYMRARAFDMLGQTQDATGVYQSLISRFDPVTDPEAREMMAHAIARTGNDLSCQDKFSEARLWLQRAVDEYPGTAGATSAAVSLKSLGSEGTQ